MNHSRASKIMPSLPLQILLYFNYWYTIGWFGINALLFIWKRNNMFYETSSFRWEVSMIVFLIIIDLIRLEVATKGNKTSECKMLIWSSCLSIPTIVGFSFFLRLQSYVLRLDLILNIIGLIFVSCEVILKLFMILGFYILK